MRILISNDDGIYADGLWALVREFSRFAEVIIVAPDREQSAVGTAVSLGKPLRVQPIMPLVQGVQAYSVEGTPSDSVILGLGKIAVDKIDLVVSGINQGTNLGEDVLISGTVGAALAAYQRGFPALAVSCKQKRYKPVYLQQAALFAALLARRMENARLTGTPLLNINFPDLEMSDIKGIKITGLAHRSHINSVEEGHDGKRAYYMLTRAEVSRSTDKNSDIAAALLGNITITPLSLFLNDRAPVSALEKMIDGLLEDFKAGLK